MTETPLPTVPQLATYLAARVLPALASMGLTFLCIHTLTPADYGRYSLSLLPASVAASLVGGLAAQAMLRYAHELSPAALRHGQLLFPLAAAALVCPIVLGYLAWSLGLSAAAFTAVASIPLIALMDTRRSFFIARARAGAVFALDVLRAAAALVLAWALFNAWGGRVLVPLLAQLLSVGLCLLLVRPLVAMPAEGREREVDRHYVSYGLWFAGWMAVLGVFALAERAIVESAAGIAASGRYAAQADVVNAVFSATGAALASSMMPGYLALAGHPGDAVERLAFSQGLRRLLRLGLAGTAATALGCIALGAVIGHAGLGRLSNTLTADLPTAFSLVAAGAVWTAAGFFQKPLELRGQTQLTFASAAVSLLLFMAIGPALARSIGSAGVGVAKLVAGLAFVSMVMVAARRAGA